jgi:hypothetical protein
LEGVGAFSRLGGGDMQQRTWKRSVLNAILTTALLMGVPAAGGAVACYRKHIEAIYWAWNWAEACKGNGRGCRLGLKLAEIRAPRSARVAAWRTAYRLTDGDSKMFAAIRLGEYDTRALYRLVGEEGEGSVAEDALKSVLASVGDNDISPFPDGATQREHGALPLDDEIEDQWPNPEGRYHCTTWGPSFRFGSYDVRMERRWSKWPKKSEWQLFESRCIELKRLPGPWRDLAPPREEHEDVYYQEL